MKTAILTTEITIEAVRIVTIVAVQLLLVVVVVVVVVGDSQHCCWESWSRRLL